MYITYDRKHQDPTRQAKLNKAESRIKTVKGFGQHTSQQTFVPRRRDGQLESQTTVKAYLESGERSQMHGSSRASADYL